MKRALGWGIVILTVLCVPQDWNFAQTKSESAVPVGAEVPLGPTPVHGGGKLHLFYELHLTNFSRQALELTRLEIHANAASGPLVANYSDADLAGRLLRPGLASDAPDLAAASG